MTQNLLDLLLADYSQYLQTAQDPEYEKRMRILEHFVKRSHAQLEKLGCVGVRFDSGEYVYRLGDGRECSAMRAATTPFNSTGQMQESDYRVIGADGETSKMVRDGIAAERSVAGRSESSHY